MSYYTPDYWVLIELSGPKIATPVKKVLAGWQGGWTGSDSWRLSSGVISVETTEAAWLFKNTSGSVYFCGKNNQRFNMMTRGIFNEFQGMESSGVTVKLISYGVDLVI